MPSMFSNGFRTEDNGSNDFITVLDVVNEVELVLRQVLCSRHAGAPSWAATAAQPGCCLLPCVTRAARCHRLVARGRNGKKKDDYAQRSIGGKRITIRDTAPGVEIAATSFEKLQESGLKDGEEFLPICVHCRHVLSSIHAAGETELLHAALQGGTRQAQAHGRAVGPGHHPLGLL